MTESLRASVEARLRDPARAVVANLNPRGLPIPSLYGRVSVNKRIYRELECLGVTCLMWSELEAPTATRRSSYLVEGGRTSLASGWIVEAGQAGQLKDILWDEQERVRKEANRLRRTLFGSDFRFEPVPGDSLVALRCEYRRNYAAVYLARLSTGGKPVVMSMGFANYSQETALFRQTWKLGNLAEALGFERPGVEE